MEWILIYDEDYPQSFVNRSTYFKSKATSDLSFLNPNDDSVKWVLIVKLKDNNYRSIVGVECIFNQIIKSLNNHMQL